MDFREKMEADFSKILQGAFAESVTITTGAQSITCRAVFDRAYLRVDPDTQSTVLSTSPRVVVARGLVTFPLTSRVTLVVARGTTYYLREAPENDDEGALVLHLEKA